MAKYIVIHSIRIAKDFTPETFGRLTTLGPKFLLPVGRASGKFAYQVCQCSCGNFTVVQTSNLRNGNTNSCGCFRQEFIAAKNKKHSMTGTVEHETWNSMKKRCLNPKHKSYHNYGGRGIRICDRWLDPESGFENFYADMGPRPSDKHSIDRINNGGDYCPENCKWSTRFEQNRNKRTNVMLAYNGKTQCVKDWAEELGIGGAQLRLRLGGANP
jgi:hypothetical protein